MVQPLWKTVWRCLNKRKMDLPYEPASSRLHIYPNALKQDLKEISASGTLRAGFRRRKRMALTEGPSLSDLNLSWRCIQNQDIHISQVKLGKSFCTVCFQMSEGEKIRMSSIYCSYCCSTQEIQVLVLSKSMSFTV